VAKAVLVAASSVWPALMPARELPLPGKDPEEDVDCLVRLLMAGALEFRVEPPNVSGVTARPLASALARAQLAHGRDDVTTQRHFTVNLADELARQVVQLLDGTRSHAEVAEALVERMQIDGLREGLTDKLAVSLRMLARLSLLVG
jgi:hypothetical protein